jgi:cytochrome c oxidase cbb3-type subunit I/II
MEDPTSTTPGSIMPRYPHLLTTPLDFSRIEAKMRALRTVGTPYTDGEIESARALLRVQADSIAVQIAAQQGPRDLADKEIVALAAFLQRLGTDIRWRRPTVAPLLVDPIPPAASGQGGGN